MEYSGINLPENVIIVENKYGQGYVVSEGSNLDNARYWAERSDWKSDRANKTRVCWINER